MALKIRLARGGANKRPFYRIVVADSRSPRDGRFIDKIGRYNPLLPKDHDERVVIDLGKAKSWLDKGARPTDRVARFLSEIHYREVDAEEYQAQLAASAGAEAEEGDETPSPDSIVIPASARTPDGRVLVRAGDGESDAKPLFGWKAGNNPQKAKPGQKAVERVAERKEKEEARKAAEEEAKREAQEAAKAAAEAEAQAAAEPAEEPAAEDADANEEAKS